MEVMEDGNLMDKVHILIQRDMEYYKDKQSILQEVICPGIVGGRLDFPRFVSFASMKLVMWWEEEYLAAYRKGSGFLQKSVESRGEVLETSGGCGGIVKASDPIKFVTTISKSSEQFLEHLHILTQEALDHADLSVLTGTIGAAALLKNCLWFYTQNIGNIKAAYTEQLQTCFKKYQEMEEALAERLLDLHSRLLSLYILQDADCLDWENMKSFCESERGSYIIQMWWLYMQGSKEDLWNTVPPKMAQRVFVGMLNESLTILTVRYIQSTPSQARSKLLLVDVSNLLLCVAQLLSGVCDNAEELMGTSLNSKSKILRDIHTKCQELLYFFIFRGSSLNTLHKVFSRGIESVQVFKPKNRGPLPWIMISLPNVFKQIPKNCLKSEDLPNNTIVALELMVLFNQPQPNWSLLLKVLGLKSCQILKLIITHCLTKCTEEMVAPLPSTKGCGAFLCSDVGTCKDIDQSVQQLSLDYYYDLIVASTDIILFFQNTEALTDILLNTISRRKDWAKCFDRRNMWNQMRPPWYQAMINLAKPMLPIVIKTIIDATHTGASIYQAMSIVLACFSHLWDCSNPVLAKIANIFQDNLPLNITPLGSSCFLHVLISALYSDLLNTTADKKKVQILEPDDSKSKPENVFGSFDETKSSNKEITLALAEALCSIDQDDKHTDQIDDFLLQVKESLELQDYKMEGSDQLGHSSQLCDILVSDILMSSHGKRNLKMLHHFAMLNHVWLLDNLGVKTESDNVFAQRKTASPKSLLITMFHIGSEPFDQLLTGEWQPDWDTLFQIPMGLNVEKVWLQISHRWEFQENSSFLLTNHENQVVNTVTSLLKTSV